MDPITEVTDEDMINFKLIAILMMVSILIEETMNHLQSHDPATAHKVASAYSELIDKTLSLFPDGKMTPHIIRMAKSLDIGIEVDSIPEGSKRTQ